MKITPDIRQTVVFLIVNFPELTYEQIAAKVGCGRSSVIDIARMDRITRKRGAGSQAFWKGVRDGNR